MNVVWKRYKHKQSGDGCRWNVYAECGLFTFARGDYLVRFVSANHVDWRFQGLNWAESESLRHPVLEKMPVFGQLGKRCPGSSLDSQSVEDRSRESMVFTAPNICKCLTLLIRRYASVMYLTLLRKVYRSINKPRSYTTIPLCNVLVVVVQPWMNCHLP